LQEFPPIHLALWCVHLVPSNANPDCGQAIF
jgi:hypothetical protein